MKEVKLPCVTVSRTERFQIKAEVRTRTKW